MSRPGRDALGLALAAAVGAALVAGAWALARDRIDAHAREARRDALALVLPPDVHDNAADADRVQVVAPAWLGAEDATVHRARLRGAPSALVIAAVAPDGYAGPIGLLVAVDARGRVLGVRVTDHRETPGLGDAIAVPDGWIAGFRGRSLGAPPAAAWGVRRDGGAFDQLAGATVTPRAVVDAVARALAFAAAHGDAVHAAPAGASLRFDDAPERPAR